MHYRDGILWITSLDPRPHSSHSLFWVPNKGWAICILLSAHCTGDFHNSMPAQLKLFSRLVLLPCLIVISTLYELTNVSSSGHFQFVGFWRTDKFTSATTTTTTTSCSSTRLATETRPSTSPSTSWRGRIKVLKSRENFWKDSCAELKTKVPRSKCWSALLKSFLSLSFIKSFYRCFSGRLYDFCPNFSSSSFLKDDLLMKREKANF